jgi:hypothetical protein
MGDVSCHTYSNTYCHTSCDQNTWTTKASRSSRPLLPSAAAELETLEEHLLVCSLCVKRAEEAQDYVDAMRAAAAVIEGD